MSKTTDPKPIAEKPPLLKKKPITGLLLAGACLVSAGSYLYWNQSDIQPVSSNSVVSTVAKTGVSLPGLTDQEQLDALQKMQLNHDEYTKLLGMLEHKDIKVIMLPIRSPVLLPGGKPANLLISTGLYSKGIALNPTFQTVPVIIDKTALVTFTLMEHHTMDVPLQAQDSFGPVMLPILRQAPVTIGIIAQ